MNNCHLCSMKGGWPRIRCSENQVFRESGVGTYSPLTATIVQLHYCKTMSGLFHMAIYLAPRQTSHSQDCGQFGPQTVGGKTYMLKLVIHCLY